MRKILTLILICLLVLSCVLGAVYYFLTVNARETKILNQIIERMEAETRVAEVLVKDVVYEAKSQQQITTIKFLEYDSLGNPMEPKYFSFTGNIIQFQSLVIRFDDLFIKKGDELRGKSIHLFWKVFMLDGKNTQEYIITQQDTIPEGYKIRDVKYGDYEKELWMKFWEYALDKDKAKKVGIKNAQIEAPGTMFIPGTIYTIVIEHDGGMRIDSAPIPEILKGELIPG